MGTHSGTFSSSFPDLPSLPLVLQPRSTIHNTTPIARGRSARPNAVPFSFTLVEVEIPILDLNGDFPG